MREGYVKLWRQVLESAVFQDAELLRLFVWCLCKAAHTKSNVRFQSGVPFVVVSLVPGQFVTGRNSGAAELGMHPSTFWKRLTRISLKPYELVTIQSDNLFSVVTICNWQRYQMAESDREQPLVTTKGQPGDNQVTHLKNVENVKNVEKEETREKMPGAFKDFIDYKTGGRFKIDLQKWRSVWGELRQGNVQLEPIFVWALEHYDGPVGDPKFFASGNWTKIVSAYNKASKGRRDHDRMSDENYAKMKELTKRL